jgi:hypothetical protein
VLSVGTLRHKILRRAHRVTIVPNLFEMNVYTAVGERLFIKLLLLLLLLLLCDDFDP